MSNIWLLSALILKLNLENLKIIVNYRNPVIQKQIKN